MTKKFLSKHKKYTTKNPVSKLLVENFIKNILAITKNIPYQNVLEVGCGEGIILYNMQNFLDGKKAAAVDLDEKEIETAKQNIPFADLRVASAYQLPFVDNQFDLVICCEVMEHLENPAKALAEIHRVSKKFCLLSVPNEPLWRALNMSRGAYLSSFGNTPGHINHWTPRSFKKFVETNFHVETLTKPLPWTMVLGRKLSGH